jgi:flagellar biosynthesis protein FlhF
MKIKRFVAADMRQAIRDVREEQGPDAVILSNKRVADGVEIIAAIDYDASLIDHAAARASERSDKRTSPPPAVRKPPPPGRFSAERERQEPALAGMRRELNGLRDMLEGQLSSLAWNDLSRRAPVRANVMRELSGIGLASELTARLVDELPGGIEPKLASRLPLAMLAKRLPIAGESMIDDGGIIAFLGPTGVGKTTSIAKLAARFALRHGHRHVALVSTDGFRIGAQEQLFTFGRILGVPVYVANGAEELADVLERVEDKRLVLIDTAGVSHRDVRLAEQFKLLRPAHRRIETCLVLAANAETDNLDQVARAYAPLAPRWCVATKLDEAASLGGVLSAAMTHRLPLAFVSDGQRVPEDIRRASAHKLVCEAVACAKRSNRRTDERQMARRFGARAVNYA